ncbi:MAG TPA: gamma carbonic anhydrase family protein [Phycisphaerae bacterium]|jgi:carbonic anhydrase/acetyltransferase-like protein (isoleucine patch superfamily)
MSFSVPQHQVRLGEGVYLAPTAYVGGDVELGDGCTVMHFVVIRGDVSPIRIGRHVNVQDGTIIHTNRGVPLEIGDEVGIGHRAIVHARRVGAHTLIGMGAIILDDVDIGRGCIIAAGAVVPPRTVIPAGKLVMGVPARVVRSVTERERAYIADVVASYLELGRQHAAGMYPNVAVPDANR